MKMRRDDMGRARVKPVFPLAWLWEPVEGQPGVEVRPMFGGRALYVDDKLALFFCAKEDPWCGVCVGTDRENHAALIAEFPALAPHSVLPKWLYLSEGSEVFEKVATRLVRLAVARDPRMGVAGDKKRKNKRS